MSDLIELNSNELALIDGGSAEDVCKLGFESAGGWIGGLMTSETGGWGVVPGTMIGSLIGGSACHRLLMNSRR